MSPSQPHRTALVLTLSLALPLAACSTTDSTSSAPCDVTLAAVSPSEGLPGAQVAVTGRPFTTPYDTALYVGTARATVLGVTREGCEAWDECLEAEDCSGCDDCDPCDALYPGCVEAVDFTVPDVEAGQVTVRIFNRHGESDGLPFEVLAPPSDTGTQDTGTQDTGPIDSGPDDTSAADTAHPDTSLPDGDSGETTDTDTAQPDTTTPPR
ncbi:MAG: hypothetical protein ABIO70_26150 [Pseudomonadota bacterium]